MIAPLTPLDWKRRAIKYYPEKVAIIDEQKTFTYKEFGERTDQLSFALHSAGIQQGDHVAVMLPNTHYMLECFYGISQIGAVMVPLNYRLAAKDLEYIINHSDAKTLIVDAEFGKIIEDIQEKLPIEKYIVVEVEGQDSKIDGVSYENFIQVDSGFILPEVRIDENQMLTLNYTSGTTSNPKGVMLSHRSNYLNAANFLYHLKVVHDDVYLHTLPMFHANGWGGGRLPQRVGPMSACAKLIPQ